MKARVLVPGVVRSVSNRDLLQMVDAAYANASDDQAWLRGVLEVAQPVLEWGLGVCAYTFTLGEGPQVAHCVYSCGGEALHDVIHDMHRQSPSVLLRSAFNQNRASTLSDFLSRDTADWSDAVHRLARHGARDVMAVIACDPSASGLGMALGSLLPSTGSLSVSVQHRWLQIASHLNAGLRLRSPLRAEAEAARGISSKPRGAGRPALGKVGRAALRQAARAIDRARGQCISQPGESLALEQALVTGEWSLLDRFDADGRHFVVACRNARDAPAPAALSQREDQVTELAARGHSNKLIASLLGLSPGSVATLLHRAARKLGAGSRTLLTQQWRNRQAESLARTAGVVSSWDRAAERLDATLAASFADGPGLVHTGLGGLPRGLDGLHAGLQGGTKHAGPGRNPCSAWATTLGQTLDHPRPGV